MVPVIREQAGRMPFDVDEAIRLLEPEVQTYQVPVVDLIAAQSRDPFKILVATILSARTKDEVTAAAARRLFARAQTLDELEGLGQTEIEALIHPVGFFRNKAAYLARLPGALREDFDGQVPDDMDSLVTLPGVGRKTANLVVAVAFHKPAICVDTHVHRIMNIWGYVDTPDPLKTEMALREKLPARYWIRINSILVAFGQGTCKPQRPHCDCCVIAHLCPRIGVTLRILPNGATKRAEKRAVPEGLRLVSWNVNGLRAILKKGFLDALHQLNPDIIGLQEIKALPDQLPEELRRIEGYHAYWYPARRKGYSGTAVYSRQEPLRVIYGIDDQRFDVEGRVLTLEFADFFFVNIYFPNAQDGLRRIDYKSDFNRAMFFFFDRLAREKTVVACGDYNVAHRPIDLARPEANEESPGYSAVERAWMDEFIGAGYVDTFRKFNQEPEHYTWWSYRANARIRNVGWRIDYFFVDPASEDRILEAAIHDEVQGSDHCPVSIRFRSNPLTGML